MRRNGFFLLFILIFTQCKSTGARQASGIDRSSTPIILLLADNLFPSDLESIKSMQIQSEQLISRSQNLWLVKVAEGKEASIALFEKLKEDKRILEVSIAEASLESSVIKNTKSGQSSPIKN